MCCLLKQEKTSSGTDQQTGRRTNGRTDRQTGRRTKEQTYRRNRQVKDDRVTPFASSYFCGRHKSMCFGELSDRILTGKIVQTLQTCIQRWLIESECLDNLEMISWIVSCIFVGAGGNSNLNGADASSIMTGASGMMAGSNAINSGGNALMSGGSGGTGSSTGAGTATDSGSSSFDPNAASGSSTGTTSGTGSDSGGTSGGMSMFNPNAMMGGKLL